MSTKKKRRILQLIGLTFGLIFGYLRPLNMQSLLPFLGVGVGISYFILTSTFSDEETAIDDVTWFPLVQLFMYFLIGGALTSTVLLTLRTLQMQ